MNIRPLPATMALILTTTAAAPAVAATLEERVARLESENARQAAQLEQQQATIAAQKQKFEGTPKRVKKLGEAVEEKRTEEQSGGGWFDKIEIVGLIEVEAFYANNDGFGGENVSDVVLSTFELGVASQVNDWVKVGASLLYEEDETPLEVDLAFITIANTDVTPFFLTAGQLYVPFGAYETNLVSDPLTLEIGETRETTARVGFVYQGFSGSVYGFNGDNQIDGKDQINNWGANLSFAQESEDLTWAVGASYINNLGDSDSLQDTIADNRTEAVLEAQEAAATDPNVLVPSADPTDRVDGWTANFGVIYKNFNFIAEYLTAAGKFDPIDLARENNGVIRGAKPSAWNLELGYSFPVLGKESTAAVAYQESKDALGLALPKSRLLVGWSVEVYKFTSLSFEYHRDNDYETSEGGTGDSSDTYTAQLAVTF